MKIYLNLLPEEKKEEIKRKKIFLKVIRNELIFSIPIVAFFLILFTINFSLEIRMRGMEEGFSAGNSQAESKELESYEEKFSEINSKITAISGIQKNHLNWLGVFHKINDTLEDGIYLSDLATDDWKISLVGKAKTRDNFLKFQENIKGQGCFSDVEAPLSSLVSKENVGFQINFKVKEECLKNPAS